MEPIKKKYITDASNRWVAVQIPLETFERIKAILEDYGLYHFIQEPDAEPPLSLSEAKAFYKSLP